MVTIKFKTQKNSNHAVHNIMGSTYLSVHVHVTDTGEDQECVSLHLQKHWVVLT